MKSIKHERNDDMKKISGTILIASMALALMTLPLSAQTSVPAAGTTQPAAPVQQKTETPSVQTDPAQKTAAQPAESIPQVRPLKPSPMEVGEPETEESLLVSAEWLKKNKGRSSLWMQDRKAFIREDTYQVRSTRAGHILQT